MAPSPLGERFDAGAAWTGDELLVVGGTGSQSVADPAAAAYSPALDRWRIVPAPEFEVHQERPRGVRHVRGVDGEARELCQEPAIDGAEGEIAALGARSSARCVVEKPRDFGPRKVRIEDEAGAAADLRFEA